MKKDKRQKMVKIVTWGIFITMVAGVLASALTSF